MSPNKKREIKKHNLTSDKVPHEKSKVITFLVDRTTYEQFMTVAKGLGVTHDTLLRKFVTSTARTEFKDNTARQNND